MSPFSKTHAKILADMLSEEARKALLLSVGRGPKEAIFVKPETISELVDLELGRQDRDILKNVPVFIVSSRGKKVAECL